MMAKEVPEREKQALGRPAPSCRRGNRGKRADQSRFREAEFRFVLFLFCLK